MTYIVRPFSPGFLGLDYSISIIIYSVRSVGYDGWVVGLSNRPTSIGQSSIVTYQPTVATGIEVTIDFKWGAFFFNEYFIHPI